MRPRLQCASVVGIAAVVVAIVGLLQLPQPSVAVCQECGTDSGVLCWNETAFSICIGGVVSAADPSAVHVCPLGTVCFDGPTICGNSDDTIADCPPTTTTTATTAAANRCNECSTDRRYGCLSATTFGLCFGTVAVSMAVVVECPAGMWCDVEDGAFCTNDSTRISCNQPTTTTTTATTVIASTATTVATTMQYSTTTGIQQATTNVTELCSSYQMSGRFAQPLDTTCKKYFFCYVYGGQIRGQTFECVGLSYYSQSQQRCVSPYTYRCVNGTLISFGAESLSLK